MRSGSDGREAGPDAVTEVILRWSSGLGGSSLSRPDSHRPSLSISLPEPIAVLDDLDAALTTALLAGGLTPRTWCDDVRDELAVPPPSRCATPSEALIGARTVLWRLPKAVSAVDEYAELIARHASAEVLVVAGGRDKHLSRSMNDALARHFDSVSATLGHRKARALVAARPRPGRARWPASAHLDALNVTVAAHGATFSTNRLDRGTALLASCFERLPDAGSAIDLGCGSGILTTLLARRGVNIHAVDVAWSATDATRLTAAANGVEAKVLRRAGLAGWRQPVDLIVTNPPFHVRSAKDTSPTRALFDQASDVLVEGGELWCVYNAHLPYLHWLRDTIGPTEIVARDRAYVVTRSVRRHEAGQLDRRV
ncbi:class I SAM-dependent methyltransferase [Micropruina sp.]|uniref:class I SAM-dependent methyltransferase n=1 Tax=Micropruina sp. TaxID=2737536 RepID=UPI0039E59A0C